MILTGLSCLIGLLASSPARAQKSFDNPDTIVVARDGTGQFRNISEAIEVCRAFMEYHKVIYIKKGTYKEKIILPQWLTNIELCGEDARETIITWDDHANIPVDLALNSWPLDVAQELRPTDGRVKIGTFRTFTLRIDGSSITVKNLTVENNAPRLGQAVALHVNGDKVTFIGCRFLGNQDTIYTGNGHCRQFFRDCYIEGTTDFIFGPSTAWFESCDIYCKINSYITAASTPQDAPYGYVFNNCRITCGPQCERMFLGRPWRDYGYTLFMNCELPAQICPEGWHHWQKEREQTARYLEYNNRGAGADTSGRVAWSRQLTKKEAQAITPETVFSIQGEWSAIK